MTSIIKHALGALLLGASGLASAAGMDVSSTAFSDGGMMSALYAGDTGDCGGKNVSPPVAWSNLPAGSKSVVVFLTDPDGAKGIGVVHWVAYNIDAERGQLKQGEGQSDGAGATVGKNVAGSTTYRGMCPPAGDLPHHYILSVVATDLAPTALPAGLTRDDVLAALKGHALAGQSVVGRYGR